MFRNFYKKPSINVIGYAIFKNQKDKKLVYVQKVEIFINQVGEYLIKQEDK